MTHLTENLLGKILNSGKYTFEHNKYFKDTRYRPDYICHEIKLIVEFDGYHHYCDIKTQTRDMIKDNFFRGMGYSIVRIPYFIQLTKEVYDSLLGDFYIGVDESLLIVDYPHGFISSKAKRIADFNLIGLNKFLEQMTFCFRSVANQVFDTCIEDICAMLKLQTINDVSGIFNDIKTSKWDFNGALKYIAETHSNIYETYNR